MDISRFSRLASLVVYKVYEHVLASSGIASPAAQGAGAGAGVGAGAGAGKAGSSGGSTIDMLEKAVSGISVAAVGASKEPAEARYQRLIRDKFIEHDADDDNRLSPAEFATLLSDFPVGLSNDQIAQLRAAADADKDGFVDWPEFSVFASTTFAGILASFSEHQRKESAAGTGSLPAYSSQLAGRT